MTFPPIIFENIPFLVNLIKYRLLGLLVIFNKFEIMLITIDNNPAFDVYIFFLPWEIRFVLFNADF